MVSFGEKFWGLQLISKVEVTNGSHQKLVWVCNCGRETNIEVKRVTHGGAKSCGRCNEISKEEMTGRKFGHLQMKNPEAILPGSGKNITWICDCGRETETKICLVINGNTKSCGRCNEISKEEMTGRKFGKLQIKVPETIKPGSHTRTTWICDCGRETIVEIKLVTSGNTKSCGRCNEVSKEEMSKRKFGHLRMKDPDTVLLGSNKKKIWICDCGQEIKRGIFSVTSGNTKSCGFCYSKAFSWWDENREIIRSLRCPIDPANVPDGFIVLQTIKNTKSRFLSICPACGDKHSSKWGDIRQGRGITCGCTYNGSSLNSGIVSFIRSFGLSVVTEYKVDGLKYDVFVPDKNLLIEMNGLKWHSADGAKQRDTQKFKNAIESGYQFMMIFEDEWKTGRIKNTIVKSIGVDCSISTRPSKCLLKQINTIEANRFYDKFHYIGKCNPTNNYGAFFNDKLIACISFGRPTRQNSKFEYELLRMASDPICRIHGIWTKLLSVFIKDKSPFSIVSFSDNRLFSGDVYTKMGFILNGLVKPDYYWTNGYKRFHKSTMRKKESEKNTGMTETEIRKLQGYDKIWDLGKKRWAYGSFSDQN